MITAADAFSSVCALDLLSHVSGAVSGAVSGGDTSYRQTGSQEVLTLTAIRCLLLG